jgi:hypothetical protein
MAAFVSRGNETKNKMIEHIGDSIGFAIGWTTVTVFVIVVASLSLRRRRK